MNKTERVLTVSGMSTRTQMEVPTIRIQGLWLKEYGFDVHTKYKVTCKNNKLVLEPIKEERA